MRSGIKEQRVEISFGEGSVVVRRVGDSRLVEPMFWDQKWIR